MLPFYIFILIFGSAVGSFLSAYTYRWPRGISVSEGRSFCPHCHKNILWFDNIPLLSYFLLGGKCRDCGKKISLRYPLIELSTGVLYLLTVSLLGRFGDLGILHTIYYVLLATILVAIFVIDLEQKLIPDELVFLLFVITFTALMFSSNNKFFTYLLSAFSASLFILALNLITHGRGMGLGDVKLALAGGLFFGYPQTIVWLFLSFIIGAVVGLFLIALDRAKFGKQIPFGPFLVGSFFIMMFWGERLVDTLLPWLYLSKL